jgi:hypothetical protein
VSLYSNTLGVVIAQNTYATDAGVEIAALRQLLDRVDLNGLLVQADALHANRPFFIYLEPRDAYFLIAVKHSGRKGSQVTKDRLTYGHNTPWQANKRERKRGRDLTWTLRVCPTASK